MQLAYCFLPNFNPLIENGSADGPLDTSDTKHDTDGAPRYFILLLPRLQGR